MKRYAVVDIGTLKVKLQVVEASSRGKIKTIEQSNNLTCLGCHTEENNNRPMPENLERCSQELIRCKEVLQKLRVDEARVVSTHALREMGKIGKEVAADLEKKTGFKIEVISAQEEAELFYRAVLRDFKSDEDFTIMDVGGGSVQILIGNKKN